MKRSKTKTSRKRNNIKLSSIDNSTPPVKRKNTAPFSLKEEQILNEAVRLFADKGYHTTTLDEIASKLGITKAALYYYFSSKNHILRSIMKRSVSGMHQTIKIGRADTEVLDKLRTMIVFITQTAGTTRDEAKVFFEQIDLLPSRTRVVLKTREKEIISTMANVLEEGVDKGIFEIDDPKICTYMILGLCNWTYHWYKRDGSLTPQQIGEFAADLVLKGILKR